MSAPTQYRKKPMNVEAAQHDGLDFTALQEVAGDKVRIDPGTGALELLAGKDGAQGWVPVPVGHWIVRNPGDLSDVWPVDAEFFARTYDEVIV